MKSKELSIIILRVLGIYCLIESLVMSQTIYYVFTMLEEFTSDRSKMIIASLSPGIIILLSGIALIAFSTKLSNWITPASEESNENVRWTLSDIQSVLFSAVGVLIFLHAIQNSFARVSQLVRLIANDSYGLPYNSKMIRDTWVSITLNIIQMLLGVGLFFGSYRLSLLWQQMREWSPNKEIDKRN